MFILRLVNNIQFTLKEGERILKPVSKFIAFLCSVKLY